MRELILACSRGEATFDAFASQTIKYWRTCAADLLRKWDHPPAVEEEDLVQEMLLGAWQAIETVDVGRGDPRKYVVFGAVKGARRWLHRQRQAYGFARCRKGADPRARYPLADGFVDVGEEVETRGGLDASEQAVALLEAMQQAQDARDREILEAFWRTRCVEDMAAGRCRSTSLQAKRAEYRRARVRVRRDVCQIAAKAANY